MSLDVERPSVDHLTNPVVNKCRSKIVEGSVRQGNTSADGSAKQLQPQTERSIRLLLRPFNEISKQSVCLNCHATHLSIATKGKKRLQSINDFYVSKWSPEIAQAPLEIRFHAPASQDGQFQGTSWGPSIGKGVTMDFLCDLFGVWNALDLKYDVTLMYEILTPQQHLAVGDGSKCVSNGVFEQVQMRSEVGSRLPKGQGMMSMTQMSQDSSQAETVGQAATAPLSCRSELEQQHSCGSQKPTCHQQEHPWQRKLGTSKDNCSLQHDHAMHDHAMHSPSGSVAARESNQAAVPRHGKAESAFSTSNLGREDELQQEEHHLANNPGVCPSTHQMEANDVKDLSRVHDLHRGGVKSNTPSKWADHSSLVSSQPHAFSANVAMPSTPLPQPDRCPSPRLGQVVEPIHEAYQQVQLTGDWQKQQQQQQQQQQSFWPMPLGIQMAHDEVSLDIFEMCRSPIPDMPCHELPVQEVAGGVTECSVYAPRVADFAQQEELPYQATPGLPAAGSVAWVDYGPLAAAAAPAPAPASRNANNSQWKMTATNLGQLRPAGVHNSAAGIASLLAVFAAAATTFSQSEESLENLGAVPDGLGAIQQGISSDMQTTVPGPLNQTAGCLRSSNPMLIMKKASQPPALHAATASSGSALLPVMGSGSLAASEGAQQPNSKSVLENASLQQLQSMLLILQGVKEADISQQNQQSIHYDAVGTDSAVMQHHISSNPAPTVPQTSMSLGQLASNHMPAIASTQDCMSETKMIAAQQVLASIISKLPLDVCKALAGAPALGACFSAQPQLMSSVSGNASKLQDTKLAPITTRRRRVKANWTETNVPVASLAVARRSAHVGPSPLAGSAVLPATLGSAYPVSLSGDLMAPGSSKRHRGQGRHPSGKSQRKTQHSSPRDDHWQEASGGLKAGVSSPRSSQARHVPPAQGDLRGSKTGFHLSQTLSQPVGIAQSIICGGSAFDFDLDQDSLLQLLETSLNGGSAHPEGDRRYNSDPCDNSLMMCLDAHGLLGSLPPFQNTATGGSTDFSGLLQRNKSQFGGPSCQGPLGDLFLKGCQMENGIDSKQGAPEAQFYPEDLPKQERQLLSSVFDDLSNAMSSRLSLEEEADQLIQGQVDQKATALSAHHPVCGTSEYSWLEMYTTPSVTPHDGQTCDPALTVPVDSSGNANCQDFSLLGLPHDFECSVLGLGLGKAESLFGDSVLPTHQARGASDLEPLIAPSALDAGLSSIDPKRPFAALFGK